MPYINSRTALAARTEASRLEAEGSAAAREQVLQAAAAQAAQAEIRRLEAGRDSAIKASRSKWQDFIC